MRFVSRQTVNMGSNEGRTTKQSEHSTLFILIGRILFDDYATVYGTVIHGMTGTDTFFYSNNNNNNR